MSLETNYTVEDTKSDFERFKEGGLDWNQIRGFNDEHKWWIIRNKPRSSFLCHDELMTDEMLKECILLGYCDFVRFSIFGNKNQEEIDAIVARVKSLNLTEAEWLQGIKNRIPVGMFLEVDSYGMLVFNCAELTYTLIEALFYKFPMFIFEQKVYDTLLGSEDKYKYTDHLIHLILDENLHMGIAPDWPLSKETWDYIESRFDDTMRDDEIIKREDCPASIRRKEIERGHYISRAMEAHMTADEIVYWYELYGNDIRDVKNELKDVYCEEWENVVSQKPELFKYIYKPKAKVCEEAIKADPLNIQYVPNPSEKLKVLAIQLNPKAKKYVKMTEKTCKALGIDFKVETKENNPYPAKYYLVSFNEDLCDEGYLHYHEIVEGKDMIDFMRQTFRVSFGNLDDDEGRRVSECANVKAITEEEYEILKKLGLDYSSSGYFGFGKNDEDDED